MDQSLTAFLTRTLDRPWRWGRVDCTMWVADWCVARWGVDPAAPWRDRYRTEAEMLALIPDGLLALVAPRMVFCRPALAPVTGDVGIVAYDGKEVSAIRVDGQWAIRTPRGVLQDDMAMIAAWGD